MRRGLRFIALSEKNRKPNRLQMLLQRHNFLVSYLKILSVGPAGVWTYGLPLSRPALIPLSLPGGGSDQIRKAVCSCCFLPLVHQDRREYSETLVLPVHVPDTRVVHLELVHSMDIDDFITCFKRFKNVRRKVVQLRCDRGTNFVGGENELSESLEQWNKHQTECEQLQRGCKWKKKMKSIMGTQMVKAIFADVANWGGSMSSTVHYTVYYRFYKFRISALTSRLCFLLF